MGWVEDHIARIEQTGTTDGIEVQGRPIVLVRMTGAVSGRERPVPVMRVEQDGSYAAVASKGGAPQDPVWRANLDAHPDVTVQDGTAVHAARARRLAGAERARWWEVAVAAYPPYAEYQQRTDREIPVYVLEPW